MVKPFRACAFAALGALAVTASTSGGARFDHPVTARSAVADGRLTVMTYNIKGLPWPVAMGRGEAIAAIADRLAALRRVGKQPHVVLLQEAFTADAAALGARAGYAHAAYGPGVADASTMAAGPADRRYLAATRWDRGEGMGKQVGSGLIILSDYPVTGTDRMAFPDFACAGFDCLANKGVLIAHLKVPGVATPVSIVNTHLNARKAAGVSIDRTGMAFARQVDILAHFVASHVPASRPLLIGGDMNIGDDADRAAVYFRRFAQAGLGFVRPHLGAARQALARQACADAIARRDLARASERAKDWLFARGAHDRPMPVLSASVPFGAEADGSSLSDHYGYAVEYAPAPTTRLATRYGAGSGAGERL